MDEGAAIPLLGVVGHLRKRAAENESLDATREVGRARFREKSSSLQLAASPTRPTSSFSCIRIMVVLCSRRCRMRH